MAPDCLNAIEVAAISRLRQGHEVSSHISLRFGVQVGGVHVKQQKRFALEIGQDCLADKFEEALKVDDVGRVGSHVYGLKQTVADCPEGCGAVVVGSYEVLIGIVLPCPRAPLSHEGVEAGLIHIDQRLVRRDNVRKEPGEHLPVVEQHVHFLRLLRVLDLGNLVRDAHAAVESAQRFVADVDAKEVREQKRPVLHRIRSPQLYHLLAHKEVFDRQELLEMRLIEAQALEIVTLLVKTLHGIEARLLRKKQGLCELGIRELHLREVGERAITREDDAFLVVQREPHSPFLRQVERLRSFFDAFILLRDLEAGVSEELPFAFEPLPEVIVAELFPYHAAFAVEPAADVLEPPVHFNY